MRLLLRDLLTYFRPSFHPWQHDDRALAARALATLSPPLVAPMPK
jgi:predicted metal-dependent hydrolase